MKEEKYSVHLDDWFCSKCGAYINAQNRYTVREFEWECTKCGYKNIISTTSNNHQITLEHGVNNSYREIDKYENQNEKLKHWLRFNFLNRIVEDYSFNNKKVTTNTNFDIVIKSKNIFHDDNYHTVEIHPAFKYTRKFKKNQNTSKVPYFVFEVSTLSDCDEEYLGDLFKKEADSTEYYMLIWLWVDQPFSNEYIKDFRLIDLLNFNYNSIKEVFLQIIPKRRIVEYANHYGVERFEELTYGYNSKFREKFDELNYKVMSLNKEGHYPYLLLDDRFTSRPIYIVIKDFLLDDMAIYSQSLSPINNEKFTLSKRVKQVCKLYKEGKSIGDIKNIFGIKNDDSIIDYLFTGAYNGELTTFDSETRRWTKQIILKALQIKDDGKLKTIRTNTNEKISYDEIRKFLLELYLLGSTIEDLYLQIEHQFILDAEEYLFKTLDSPKEKERSDRMGSFLEGALDAYGGNEELFWDSYNDND